jgi:RNA-directed DNA polymerase
MKQEDKILRMFFEPQRWQDAIAKGVDKDIRKDQLYKLTKPEIRQAMYVAIRDGKYMVAPPHTALIPKDNGDFRTVYVNEPMDRIVLSIANDLLFELCPEMTHPRCKSYQKGIGCGRVVQEVSRRICGSAEGKIVGWKSDLSKYFDSVPIRYVDEAFDKVEAKHGKSKLIDVLRRYYHSDIFFDTDNVLQEHFQSLKQGCAVAAWLADVILYDLDEKLSSLDGYYVRYSDDMLFVGKDYEKAMQCLVDGLHEREMKLNPKKVEYLDSLHWFKFLGFSIKGKSISLSSTRIKTFQKEIEKRTVKRRDTTLRNAVNSVNKYLYKGFGGFSWATQVLPIVNVKEDVNTLNSFVMDCLRAVQTKKRKIGGLGFVKTQSIGCISRGKGRNVSANREKTQKEIAGYMTMTCMQNAIKTRRGAYDALVMTL